MDGPLFLDAAYAANPPLTNRGFIALISVLTAINVASAAAYLAVGARTAAVSVALDLAAVVVAFAVGAYSARRRERIQVSADEVRVVLETAKGDQTVWKSPTAFTQVTLVGEVGRESDLRLRLSGREYPVARSLSHRQRLQFSRSLDAAISRARAGQL